ncbi:MAG: hypothetical protein ACLU37_10155 [Collinsella sp.]
MRRGARVEQVDVADLRPRWNVADEQGFHIVASQDQTAHTTLSRPISPPAMTVCASCSTPTTGVSTIPL